MKDSIRQRLDKMSDRFEEIGRLLADPEVAGGSDRFRDLSREYARLTTLAERYRDFRTLERDLAAAEELRTDADTSLRTLAEEESARLTREIATAEAELRRLLLPRDPRDERSVFLEIRAG